MQYRRLGRTGLDVSILSLGTGGPNQFGQMRYVSPENIHELTRRALDSGVNYFDTASDYSNSETLLGEALRGVSRDQYYLSSKVSPLDENRMISAAEARRKVERSLKRLNVDMLDILFLHKVRPEIYVETADRLLPTLHDLRDEGKIRYIGITESSRGDPQHNMLKRALRDDFFDSIMLAYHVANRSAETEVLPLATAKGVGVIGMRAARHLVFRNLSERLNLFFRALRVSLTRPLGESTPKARIWVLRSALRQTLADRKISIARDSGQAFLELPEGGYTFAISHPAIATVLTGTTDCMHLKQNMAAVLAPALTPSEIDRIEAFFR